MPRIGRVETEWLRWRAEGRLPDEREVGLARVEVSLIRSAAWAHAQQTALRRGDESAARRSASRIVPFRLSSPPFGGPPENPRRAPPDLRLEPDGSWLGLDASTRRIRWQTVPLVAVYAPPELIVPIEDGSVILASGAHLVRVAGILSRPSGGQSCPTGDRERTRSFSGRPSLAQQRGGARRGGREDRCGSCRLRASRGAPGGRSRRSAVERGTSGARPGADRKRRVAAGPERPPACGAPGTGATALGTRAVRRFPGCFRCSLAAQPDGSRFSRNVRHATGSDNPPSPKGEFYSCLSFTVNGRSPLRSM